ncbi:hypothetical protein ACQP04_21600 [Pseudonocardia halophobica]|uniref:hypothetical protein n=1 Tax=Pseudonocardia halophobica TaxID=29401 RepID=UPI003D8EADB4
MTTVAGLPAHILLVHAVVVLVPLTALLLVVESLWPAARRRLAWPAAALALVAVVVAAGSVVTVYRIGDSGARAAWTGQFSATPLPRGGAPVTPG